VCVSQRKILGEIMGQHILADAFRFGADDKQRHIELWVDGGTGNDHDCWWNLIAIA
jgi:hypothetical protein